MGIVRHTVYTLGKKNSKKGSNFKNLSHFWHSKVFLLSYSAFQIPLSIFKIKNSSFNSESFRRTSIPYLGRSKRIVEKDSDVNRENKNKLHGGQDLQAHRKNVSANTDTWTGTDTWVSRWIPNHQVNCSTGLCCFLGKKVGMILRNHETAATTQCTTVPSLNPTVAPLYIGLSKSSSKDNTFGTTATATVQDHLKG